MLQIVRAGLISVKVLTHLKTQLFFLGKREKLEEKHGTSAKRHDPPCISLNSYRLPTKNDAMFLGLSRP